MFKEIIPRVNGRANTTPNAATLAFMRWTAADYAAQQAHYVALREWYNGNHNIPLTDRQKEYLNVDPEFDEWSLNYLPLPLDMMVERLMVVGFDGPEGIGGKDGLLMKWWEANRMDAMQGPLMRAAGCDGDTYMVIEPPDDKHPYPQFSHNKAHDGVEGVKVHYLSNLIREMTMASKVWSESRFDDRGNLVTVQRLNLYMPTVIEKYENVGKGWQPYQPDGEAWPIPWPIGVIPVVHFRWGDNGGNWGKSELEKLMSSQMGLNKSAIDALETGDKTGAQLLTLTGATWPADAPDVRAGDVLSVSSEGASWGSIPAGDLVQLNENVDGWIVRMAQLSRMPLQNFQLTGQIASAATQQADDSQLVARCAAESLALGNAWEDVMRIALLVHAEYGEGEKPVLKPTDKLATQWADFERIDRLAIEERRANILTLLINAGVSLDGALTLEALGYTEEEQRAMLRGDFVPTVSQ